MRGRQLVSTAAVLCQQWHPCSLWRPYPGRHARVSSISLLPCGLRFANCVSRRALLARWWYWKIFLSALSDKFRQGSKWRIIFTEIFCCHWKLVIFQATRKFKVLSCRKSFFLRKYFCYNFEPGFLVQLELVKMANLQRTVLLVITVRMVRPSRALRELLL